MAGESERDLFWSGDSERGRWLMGDPARVGEVGDARTGDAALWGKSHTILFQSLGYIVIKEFWRYFSALWEYLVIQV